MTHYTVTNTERRIARLRAIERLDVNRFKPSPLGPGFLRRSERYTEAFRELRRRLCVALLADITTKEIV